MSLRVKTGTKIEHNTQTIFTFLGEIIPGANKEFQI